jgi:dienelactone hydrolase
MRHTTIRVLLVALAMFTVPIPGVPAVAAPALTEGVRAEEVSFAGDGGVVLHGTVVSPATGTGPASATPRRPAIVMMEGAGNRGRQQLHPAAEAFARQGVVTLIYDKRTVGYSLFHRDYSVLAEDALAGLRLLRSRADVDPARLGLWAQSEGAFAAPLAAKRSTDVKFLITVGAVGMNPAAQTAWGYGTRLRHAGVSGSLRHTLEVTAVRMMVGADLFAQATFDPAVAWENVRQPVLAQWGEYDREVPAWDSGRIIAEALVRGGNTDYTIRFVPAVRHNLNLTDNGGFDRPNRLPPDYGTYEAAWIDRSARTDRTAQTPPNATVGRIPVQDPFNPTPLTPLAWYESGWLHLAVLVVFLMGFAGYPLTAAVRRIRNRSRKDLPSVRRPAGWLAATGLAAVTGTLIYLFFMMATAANVIGPVVLGRPIPWLILQLFAVAVVVATAATIVSWRAQRREIPRVGHIRLAVLAAAGLLFLAWAAFWGLFVV